MQTTNKCWSHACFANTHTHTHTHVCQERMGIYENAADERGLTCSQTHVHRFAVGCGGCRISGGTESGSRLVVWSEHGTPTASNASQSSASAWSNTGCGRAGRGWGDERILCTRRCCTTCRCCQHRRQVGFVVLVSSCALAIQLYDSPPLVYQSRHSLVYQSSAGVSESLQCRCPSPCLLLILACPAVHVCVWV